MHIKLVSHCLNVKGDGVTLAMTGNNLLNVTGGVAHNIHIVIVALGKFSQLGVLLLYV